MLFYVCMRARVVLQVNRKTVAYEWECWISDNSNLLLISLSSEIHARRSTDKATAKDELHSTLSATQTITRINVSCNSKLHTIFDILLLHTIGIHNECNRKVHVLLEF